MRKEYSISNSYQETFPFILERGTEGKKKQQQNFLNFLFPSPIPLSKLKLTGNKIEKCSLIKIGLSLHKLEIQTTPNPKPINLCNKIIWISNKNQILLTI